MVGVQGKPPSFHCHHYASCGLGHEVRYDFYWLNVQIRLFYSTNLAKQSINGSHIIGSSTKLFWAYDIYIYDTLTTFLRHTTYSSPDHPSTVNISNALSFTNYRYQLFQIPTCLSQPCFNGSALPAA